jgi:hypothetical protein
MARQLGQKGFLEGSLSTEGIWNGTKFVTADRWATDKNNPANSSSRSTTSESDAPSSPITLKTQKNNVNQTSTGSLRYPNNITSEKTDYVTFEFFKYDPPFGRGEAESVGQTLTSGGAYNAYQTSGSKEKATPSGLKSIILYMPEDIQSQYGSNWGGAEISTAAVGMSRLVGTDPTGPGTTFSAGIGMGKSAIFKTILDQVNNFTGSSINLDQFMGSISGTILNPNTEMLYQGSTLRTFSLSFKMTPRDDNEAKTIKAICNTFKKAMLPSFTGQAFGVAKAASLITVPNVCQVTYMTGGNLNSYLPVYKLCAIAGVDVNYTADGAYATYEDGSPVCTKLTVSFKEMKVLFANDIDASTSDSPSY